MNEIPKISSSGVDGTQVSGASLMPVSAAPPLQSASVSDAVEGLLATHSRSLGGDVAARLLAASMRENSNQLADAHRKISEVENCLVNENKTNSDLRVENAKLRARIDELLGSARLKQGIIFIGTTLLGVAVDLYKDELMNLAFLLAILGSFLLLFVVLPIGGGRSK